MGAAIAEMAPRAKVAKVAMCLNNMVAVAAWRVSERLGLEGWNLRERLCATAGQDGELELHSTLLLYVVRGISSQVKKYRTCHKMCNRG